MIFIRILPLFLVFLSILPWHAEGGLSLYAFVQKSHRWKNDLPGWEGTARLLEQSLQPGKAEIRIDENPEVFLDMLKSPRSPGEFRVFYFATHMERDGKLAFTNREKWTPDELIRRIPDRKAIVVPDLIIIDCCYAESFRHQALWTEVMKAPHLFTCRANQLAWQFEIHTRQPLYVKKYYPDIHSYAVQLMGEKWNGKLSFLGFQVVVAQAKGQKFSPSNEIKKSFLKIATDPFLDERILRTRRSSEMIWWDPS